MSDTKDTKENTIYIIPRPEKSGYITADIDTESKFEMIISPCFRTIDKNNMCICFTKKNIEFIIDGYFKKGDDIYISLIFDNIIVNNDNKYNIQPILNGKPDTIINIFDRKTLEIHKIEGNWISNIYDDKTEFIFNFKPIKDIYTYTIFMDFELPYVDGIYIDNPIMIPEQLIIDNVKYNITQYSLTN